MTSIQMANPLPVHSRCHVPARQVFHLWPFQMMHWLNAVAIVTLIGSGWQIYNPSPFLPFPFPAWATNGQWLGFAIVWHLAAGTTFIFLFFFLPRI
jgi:thiosulfate reductase cytochrome b subunit